ncbi:COG2426 family protein [Aridibaculum aurantiacum]|uniref:COG2426 family protein n=1 Tax=Aridibaculum aurantiacum TaxID=2810307 RepID=UPI001A95EA95|nr:small multi-drug export protein [Aridibaculum aurantiacum]
MNIVIIYTFLLSLSPFGEARAGIPYAMFHGMDVSSAFFIGLFSNLLVFPILMWLIDKGNHLLWPYRIYKKSVIRFSRMAKKGAGKNIEKYGFWGLMVFVMIPLPGTGAYMGTIAASVFNIERKKAFWAISLGVFISCVIMAVVSQLGKAGIEAL